MLPLHKLNPYAAQISTSYKQAKQTIQRALDPNRPRQEGIRTQDGHFATLQELLDNYAGYSNKSDLDEAV